MNEKMFTNKVILITGGTGSFGTECVKFILKNFKIKKLVVYSRDENKQYLMEKEIIKKWNIKYISIVLITLLNTKI